MLFGDPQTFPLNVVYTVYVHGSWKYPFLMEKHHRGGCQYAILHCYPKLNLNLDAVLKRHKNDTTTTTTRIKMWMWRGSDASAAINNRRVRRDQALTRPSTDYDST